MEIYGALNICPSEYSTKNHSAAFPVDLLEHGSALSTDLTRYNTKDYDSVPSTLPAFKRFQRLSAILHYFRVEC